MADKVKKTASPVITGFKGFDKDLKCKGFQYEVGKTYTHDGAVKLCSTGFHFCENPLHILAFYNPATSRFGEVDDNGGASAEKETGSKRVSSRLHIKAEITLKNLIETGMKFVFDRVVWGKKDTPQTHGNSSAAQTHGKSSAAQTHGDYSAAQTHGYYSAAQTHGDYSAAQTHGDSSAAQTHGDYSAAQTHGKSSAAQTHGDYSAAQTHGKESIAVSTGYSGRASGTFGNWIVLAEWNKDYSLRWVKTAKVDGKNIKADTFYTLKGRKFVEVK